MQSNYHANYENVNFIGIFYSTAIIVPDN